MTEGAIFDIDGVLVDSPHERAWGETLHQLMRTEWAPIAPSTRYAPDRYTTEVYQQVVSGKPREEGAAALLAYFSIPDPDGARTQRLSNLKQAMIVHLIERGQFTAFEDGLRLLLALKARGVRLAAASSSKNANRMLARVWLYPFCERYGLHYPFVALETRLFDLFDANVCGRDFAHGKPHPDIFLAAAAEMRVPPRRCVVIEDAPAGVQAAKAGGMRCIGVARRGDAHLLRAAGADLVVTSLDEVNVEEL